MDRKLVVTHHKIQWLQQQTYFSIICLLGLSVALLGLAKLGWACLELGLGSESTWSRLKEAPLVMACGSGRVQEGKSGSRNR